MFPFYAFWIDVFDFENTSYFEVKIRNLRWNKIMYLKQQNSKVINILKLTPPPPNKKTDYVKKYVFKKCANTWAHWE